MRERVTFKCVVKKSRKEPTNLHIWTSVILEGLLLRLLNISLKDVGGRKPTCREDVWKTSVAP